MTNPLKTMNIESDSVENMNFFLLKKKNKENNKFKEHKGEEKKMYTENLKIAQQESQQ